jgi:hypothetical protein
VAVCLLPLVDRTYIIDCKNALARLLGIRESRFALAYPTTIVTPQQWNHYVKKHVKKSTFPCWLEMTISPHSKWCTLLIKGNCSALFDRWGCAYYIPRACTDEYLTWGTVVCGDVCSSIKQGKVVWTFTLVHALAIEGSNLVDDSLIKRMEAAKQIAQHLQHIQTKNFSWNFQIAECLPVEGNAPYLRPRKRLLSLSKSVRSEALWAVEVEEGM